MVTRMKIKGLLICAALAPVLASAQFIGSEDASPWSSFKLNPKTKISLNFKNASVDAVDELFMKSSGITIIKDPSLTKAISLSTPKPVSLNEAFSDFSAALGLMGATMSKKGNALVIQLQNQGGRGNTSFPGGIDPTMFPGGGQDQHTDLRVFYIQYANASQLAKVVNDVFAPNGQQSNNGPFQFAVGGRNQFNRGNQRGGNPLAALLGGGNQAQPEVRASSDDFSNSVIVNAPTTMMDQVASIIS